MVKNPTGRRHTSWLYTNLAEELNEGLPKNSSNLVVRAGLEPTTSRFQVQCTDHLTLRLLWYSLSAPYSGLKDFLSLKFLKILILFPSLIAYLNEKTPIH